MGTSTPNFSFYKPDRSDPVDVTTDLNANWDRADAHAHSGTYVRFTETLPIALQGLLTWRTPSNAQLIVKPSGDGTAGVFDLEHDDATGYLFHLVAGPNSGAGTYMIGIGTDQGSGGGLVASVKAAGPGIVVAHNPSATGAGLSILGYSAANFPLRVDQYVGAKPSVFTAQTGAGFGDGVATASSTTFTSATAAFTAGDVGVAITQLTSQPGAPAGAIPAGTTIASVTNGTTVVLSQAAAASATGLNFLVAGRSIGATTPEITQYQGLTAAQKIFKAYTPGSALPSSTLAVDGRHELGAGGSSAVDVNLYRATNGRLGTDHQFLALQGVGTIRISGAGKVTAVDGDFSRTPPDGQLAVVENTTDSTVRFAVRSGGVWKVGPSLAADALTGTTLVLSSTVTTTAVRTITNSGQHIEGRDATNTTTKFAIAFDGQPSFGNDALSTDVRFMSVASRARFGYNNGVVQVDDNSTNKPIVFATGGTERLRFLSTAGITIADAVTIAVGTTTGTKIGTATTQKLGFYNATPVVQPSGTPAASTDLASVILLANSLRTNLLALGLVA